MQVSFSILTSPNDEKVDSIAKDLGTHENVFIGRYKTGENEIHGKFKPEYSRQRSVVYGKSGSGKSTYMSFIISSYHKKYPNNEVILISPHKKEDEKAFVKQLKFIQQLEIDEKPEPIDATEEFKDCLVIIDDIRGFKTKEMNQFVYNLSRSLIYNCRKYGVSVIISNHELLDGTFNKLMNYESEQVTFFPLSKLAWRQIETYCKKYLSMDTASLTKIKETKSRWVTICTVIPSYVMTEFEIYTL